MPVGPLLLPEAGRAVRGSRFCRRGSVARRPPGIVRAARCDRSQIPATRSKRKGGAATAGVTAGPRAALLGVLSKCGRAPKDVRRSACRGERWRARRCFSGGGVFARDAQGHEAAGETCIRFDASGREPSALREPGG